MDPRLKAEQQRAAGVERLEEIRKSALDLLAHMVDNLLYEADMQKYFEGNSEETSRLLDLVLEVRTSDAYVAIVKGILSNPQTARGVALHDGKGFFKHVGALGYDDQVRVLDDEELCAGHNAEVMEEGVFELIKGWDAQKSAEKVKTHLEHGLLSTSHYGYIDGQEMLMHLGVLFNSEEPEHEALLCEALKSDDVMWGQLDRGYDHRVAEWIESFDYQDQQEIVDSKVAWQLQRGCGWTGLESAFVPE